MKSTPAPWKAVFDSSGGYDGMSSAWAIQGSKEIPLYPTGTRREVVAVIDCVDYEDTGSEWCASSPTAEANARLIASAPLMLKELQKLEWILTAAYPAYCPRCGKVEPEDGTHRDYCTLDAAIKAATGEE